MNLKKNIMKYSFVLIVVSSISAGAITLANEITSPIIIEREYADLHHALSVTLKEIYEDMVSFREIETELYDQTLLNLFEITLEDGSIKYVYNILELGRGPIRFLTAFDQQGYIDGIIYISHFETPGIGARIERDYFINPIVGQNANTLDIDLISGATVSSTAVSQGITTASNHLLEKED
jgi:Na+-translocating ferredoxin:NAD+ oxidoreductase subunit G